jgi:hypothetical protein
MAPLSYYSLIFHMYLVMMERIFPTIEYRRFINIPFCPDIPFVSDSPVRADAGTGRNYHKKRNIGVKNFPCSSCAGFRILDQKEMPISPPS